MLALLLLLLLLVVVVPVVVESEWRPWLDASKTVDERTALLLGAMTLEEKAAQLWQTNYMGGVNDSSGFPGVDGNPLGNETTRLAYMVHQRRLGIGSQYGVGGPGCSSSDPISHAGDFPTENATCTVGWRNALQRYVVTTSRLGIPVDFTDETLHSGAHMGTIFPVPIVLGMSWNSSLATTVGGVIAKEARSVGINRGLCPVLQVVTDCRFCRMPESFGEDPTHVSTMGAAMTRGLGGGGGPSEYLPLERLQTEAKHFAAYGCGGKDGSPCDVSERTLREIYLKPWAAFVKAGGRGVMASHQSTNWSPMHANKRLLTLLRGELQLGGGLVATDSNDIMALGSVGDGSYNASCRRETLPLNQNQTQASVARQDCRSGYHLSRDLNGSVALSITAGVDQSLTTDVFSAVPFLVQEGRLSLDMVDRATANVLRAKFASRLFDEGMYVDPTTSESLLDQPTHRALAKEVALQGITMLRNEGGVLPLRRFAPAVAVAGDTTVAERQRSSHSEKRGTVPKSTQKRTVAVLGPLGDSVHAMIGQSGYAMPGAHVVTVQRAVTAAGHTVLAADGANVIDEDQSEVAAAIVLIAKAELALLVIGENQTVCTENHDRVDLELPGGQLPLLHAAQLAATKARVPLVVILIHARPLTFGTARFQSWGGGPNALLERSDAVFSAFNPGEEGGTALWELITGVRSPEGKLTASWPQSAAHLHTTHTPWMTLRQGSGAETAYSFATEWALYPMGHGLSYTSFEYSNLRVTSHNATDPSDNSTSTMYTLAATVKNIGHVFGAETVLFLHSLWVSRVVRWERQLCGFAKVRLGPGESAVASVVVEHDALAVWREAGVSIGGVQMQEEARAEDVGSWWTEPGRYTLDACASVVDCRLRTTFDVHLS